MRVPLGMIGLLAVLAIGCAIYFAQIRGATTDKPLAQQINFVAVRSDLLSLGQAEKLYLAGNGNYASLEQLRHSNLMNSFPKGNPSGYMYAAKVDGAEHFRITASPSDSSRADLPTLSIDETMQISP